MDSDFDKSFGGTANTGKQLEVRWFFHDKDNAAYKKPCHDMPFKRRNLSYIQAMHASSPSSRKRTRKRTSEKPPIKTKKKPDLLFQCFKYRVKKYNEAFLQSPPPKTRARRVKSGKPNGNTNNNSDVPADADANDDTDDPPLAIPMLMTVTSQSKGPNCMIPEEDDNAGGSRGGAVVSLSTGEVEQDFDKEERRPPALAHMSPLSCSEEDSMTMMARGNGGRGMAVLEPIQFHSDPADRIGVHPKTRMLFHFLYLDANGLPMALTEASEELLFGHRRCPFCYFDGGTDSGILMHCVLCHGKRLAFEAARSEDGTLHVAVRRKPANQDATEDNSRDFIFNRRGQEAPAIASVPIVQRQARKAATLDVQTRKKKIRLLQEVGAQPSIIQAFVPNDTVPLRQYFHSRTNEPMLDGEWCFDSDDEPDDDWIHQMAEELLDDFVDDDVSRDEKRFMKLWNRFIKSHTLLADSIIPQKCIDFIKRHIVELVTLNLRRDLLLHLFNFWDSGLIPSAHLIACIKLFDTVAKTVSLEDAAPATDGKQNGV